MNVSEVGYTPKPYPSSPILHDNYPPEKWAVIFPPLKDELLSSWMTRIAHANFTTFTSLLWRFGRRPYEEDLDLSWKSDIMGLFLSSTGYSREELENHSLIPIQDSLRLINAGSGNKANRIQDIWFTDWAPRFRNGIRFCPLCLMSDEKPYFRKEWRLGYIVICPIHHCFLEKQCPQCHSQVAYYKLDDDATLKQCYKCEADLSNAPVEYVSTTDPLLESVTNFTKSGNIAEIQRVLGLASFISTYCGLHDLVFQGHPLIQDENIQALWLKYSKRANRLPLFRHFKYLYLILGTAIRISQETTFTFYDSYHTSPEKLLTPEPFYCSKCNYSTPSYSRILSHNFHKSEIYACDVCKTMFPSITELRIHVDNSYQLHKCCWICGLMLKDSFTLKIHFKFHSISSITLCEQCGKVLSDKSSLSLHTRIHSGDKPYKCEYCKKQFRTQQTMQDHKRVHTGERPFTCSMCGRKFKQSSTLTAHLRIHTGEKPFICKSCGQTFRTSTRIKEHERTHTGERPYQCKICGKSFSSSKSLKNHDKIHLDSRPYECVQCTKRFRTYSTLLQHRLIHSEKKEFKCSECGKEFRRKDHLSRHIMKCMGYREQGNKK